MMNRRTWFGMALSRRQPTGRLARRSRRAPTFECVESRQLLATLAAELSSPELDRTDGFGEPTYADGRKGDDDTANSPPVIHCWSDIACESLKAWCEKHDGKYGDLSGDWGDWGYCTDYDTQQIAEPERDLTLEGNAVEQRIAVDQVFFTESESDTLILGYTTRESLVDKDVVRDDRGAYDAIVFVGGWGSSMYQYDFPGDY